LLPIKDSLFDPTKRNLFRRIWGLTWPLMLANALELAVGLIDLLLVRPYGPAATAAVGLGRQVTFLVEALAVAITSGAITLVSQGVGARNRPVPAAADRAADGSRPAVPIFDPGAVVRQSLGLVLLLGVPVALAGVWLSGPLLACLQASDATRAFGEPYLRVYFGGVVFLWGNQVGAALFRGAGNVWTPLKVAAGVSALHVALNYLFIYGAGPVPPFAVQGAALGAVIARACGMLAFLFLLLRGAGPLRWSDSQAAGTNADGQEGEGGVAPAFLPPAGEPPAPPSWLRFDWPLIGYLLRVGVPMALANVFRHGSRVVFLAIAGSALGEPLQAAVGLALQVRLLGVLVALAFQTATATLVGQAIGHGSYPQAEMTGRRSVQLVALLMGSIAGVLVAVADPLAGLFIDASEVAALGAKVLRWFAVAQFFSALSIATQGALMGAGDTLPALRYTILSEWCLMLPLSYLLVELAWVPDGLLAAWVLAPALTLLLMQRRFRSGRWQRSR